MAPRGTLTVETVETPQRQMLSPSAAEAMRRAVAGPRLALLVYGVAGLGYAVILSHLGSKPVSTAWPRRAAAGRASCQLFASPVQDICARRVQGMGREEQQLLWLWSDGYLDLWAKKDDDVASNEELEVDPDE